MEKHFCITLKLLYFSNYPTLSPVLTLKNQPSILPLSHNFYRVSNNTLLCSGAYPTTTTTTSGQKKPARRHTALTLSLPLPSHTLTQKRPKTLTPYSIYYLAYILRYIGNSYKSRSERCALPAGKNLLKLSTSSKIWEISLKKKREKSKRQRKARRSLIRQSAVSLQATPVSTIYLLLVSCTTLHVLNLLSEN